MRKDWEIKEFEECLEKVVYTNKIQRKYFCESGDYPIVSQEQEFTNGYWNNSDDLFRIKKPVVIFGDHTQVLKFVDFDFVLGADGVKILQTKSEIEPRYFYYYLQNVNLGSLGYARHYRLLKELQIEFPKSISEQQNIVSILDETFAAIDQARENLLRNLQNAKQLFQSELNSIFENKGNGWEVKRLIEIGLTQTGNTPPTKEPDNYGDFIPFVKPPHFKTDGTIDAEESGLSEKGLKASRLFKANSTLMVCIGATIGKTGFTEIPVATNQQINGLSPNSNFEPRFFYYALISPSFQEKVLAEGKGAQATLPIINKTKWENLSVAFPKDKKEQKQIVTRLNTLLTETKNLENIYKQKLNTLEELKKSILQKAFRGELTKTQTEVSV